MNDHEIALSYVMGALSPVERTQVSQRRLYDRALDAAIVAEEERFGGLGDSTAAGSSDGLRLWSRIADAMMDEERDFVGAQLQPFVQGEWEVHTDRIDRKQLWSDRAFLLRCQPGAVELAHQQNDDEDEHVVVIAGDATMGRRTLRVGDYLRVDAGAAHAEMSSADGCILLMLYTARAR